MKIVSVVGARPQFIKAAMVSAALAGLGIEDVVVHTGQHYDFTMSALFFQQLGLQDPQVNLGVGSASHGAQTARILEGIEQVLLQQKPNAIIVYGDTNSTLAGALAAAKLHIPVVHIEAGLRSFNRLMPEEVNRVLTDHISDLLFVPTTTAATNLSNEGIAGNKVHVVGDVMYDAALAFKPLYLPLRDNLLSQAGLQDKCFFLATIHRAENTDDAQTLQSIVSGLNSVASDLAPVLWPIHPRTRSRMRELGIEAGADVRLIDPVGYLEMQAYLVASRGVLTDSGGLQKEAAFQGIPAVTVRNETEWIETVETGCNVLVGADPRLIREQAALCTGHVSPCSAFGDGNSSIKIAEIMRSKINC